MANNGMKGINKTAHHSVNEIRQPLTVSKISDLRFDASKKTQTNTIVTIPCRQLICSGHDSLTSQSDVFS